MKKPNTTLILCGVLSIVLYVFFEIPMVKKEFLLDVGDAFQICRWTPTGLAKFKFQLKKVAHEVVDNRLRTTYIILITTNGSQPREIRIMDAETFTAQEWSVRAKRDSLSVEHL